VHKNGRKVTAYQLVNYTEFNSSGRYIGRPVKVEVPDPVVEQETVEA